MLVYAETASAFSDAAADIEAAAAVSEGNEAIVSGILGMLYFVCVPDCVWLSW